MNELMNEVRVAYGMEADETVATPETGEVKQETLEEASSED